MIRTFRDYSALLVAFSLIVVAQKVDWGPAVRICGMTPPPQPTVIVLSPPLGKDGDFLRKIAVPLTISSHAPSLHRFTITWYSNKQGWPPGNNITASGEKTREGIVACPVVFPLRTHFTILMPWGAEDFVCLDRFRDPAYWGLDVWLPSPDEGPKWYGEHWSIVRFDNRSLEEYNLIVEE